MKYIKVKKQFFSQLMLLCLQLVIMSRFHILDLVKVLKDQLDLYLLRKKLRLHISSLKSWVFRFSNSSLLWWSKIKKMGWLRKNHRIKIGLLILLLDKDRKLKNFLMKLVRAMLIRHMMMLKVRIPILGSNWKRVCKEPNSI